MLGQYGALVGIISEIVGQGGEVCGPEHGSAHSVHRATFNDVDRSYVDARGQPPRSIADRLRLRRRGHVRVLLVHQPAPDDLDVQHRARTAVRHHVHRAHPVRAHLPAAVQRYDHWHCFYDAGLERHGHEHGGGLDYQPIGRAAHGLRQ